MLYFILKYRKGRKTNRKNPLTDSRKLEVFWILGSLITFLGIFLCGAGLYNWQTQPPKNAMEIYIVAKQWMWKIQHPEGRREIDELHVPLGQPIKLVMTSQDVIHSFYVPAFRAKMDVLPGRYSVLWFQPTQTGRYYLFCAEYCGTNHSAMIGSVIVMQPADYAHWLSGAASGGAIPSLEDAGRKLFAQLGCISCHGDRGQGAAQGPDLRGIFGKQIRLQNSHVITADEDYLRRSILQPSAEIVAGYPNVMPTFQGQISDEELAQLIAYLKALRQETPQGGSR